MAEAVRAGIPGRSRLAQAPVHDPAGWPQQPRLAGAVNLGVIGGRAGSPSGSGGSPRAWTGQADTRKVCGSILCRVAAGFGEDIVPDAASA